MKNVVVITDVVVIPIFSLLFPDVISFLCEYLIIYKNCFLILVHSVEILFQVSLFFDYCPNYK